MNQSPKVLKPEERLIVAADYSGNRYDVEMKIMELGRSLRGMGVIIKINSALRALGYDLICQLHDAGLEVFADLKLNDIPATMETDGELLSQFKPGFVTVMCSAGMKGMQALKAKLPNTEVLGVTVLTSMGEKDCFVLFGRSINEAVVKFAIDAQQAGIDGLVASPAESVILRKWVVPSMTINTPGVRPLWSAVADDDQNPDRVMTPAKAIQAGATRIVIGRPITQATNPRDAVMRTLDEIAKAL